MRAMVVGAVMAGVLFACLEEANASTFSFTLHATDRLRENGQITLTFDASGTKQDDRGSYSFYETYNENGQQITTNEIVDGSIDFVTYGRYRGGGLLDINFNADGEGGQRFILDVFDKSIVPGPINFPISGTVSSYFLLDVPYLTVGLVTSGSKIEGYDLIPGAVPLPPSASLFGAAILTFGVLSYGLKRRSRAQEA